MNPVVLSSLDWIWIGIYFVAVYAIAIWASRGQKNSADYFLAGRGIHWWIIGGSLFATNIGTEHLVGLAASGYSGGLAVGHYEWLASMIVLLLAWFFVPFYIHSQVVTMPEFLERRYNPACRIYLSVVSIIGYIFTKISVILFAGSLILNQLLGWSFWTSVLLVIVLTGIYTLFGGLKAVLYTDFLQAAVLVLGALFLLFFGLHQIGGFQALQTEVPKEFYSMFKPMSDPDFPWTGILFGAPILGIWYWCTDQFIVQRVLSAENQNDAQRGAIFAGYLKILPVFLMVVPGIIGYVLVKQGAFSVNTPNEIYPAMVANVLPSGLRGLVVAGLLAALMSSLSSTFNSCSTLVAFDLYKRIKPQATDRQIVLVGRLAVVVMMVIGVLWVPFIRGEGSLFQYLQAVQAYIAPPIAAVFLFGILAKRVNGPGALTALLTGFFVGGARFLLENFQKQNISREHFLGSFVHMHFLHFAACLFLLCLALLFVVSLLTAPPQDHQVAGLTLDQRRFTLTLHRGNLIASVVLVIIVFSLWLKFF